MQDKPDKTTGSRRDFLRNTAVGAAAVAATPGVAKSAVFSIAAPSVIGANDRIHIGHIGLGMQGFGAHVRLIKQKAGEAKDKASDLAVTAKEKAGTVAGTISSTVSEKATVVRDSAAGVVGQVKSSAQDLVDRGRTLVETKKDQVTAAVEAGKQAYQEKRNQLEADVQEDLDTAPASLGASGSATAG
jgi:hypothetical protein